MPTLQWNWLVLSIWPQPRGSLLARGFSGQDREGVVRDLFEKILSECMEFKSSATNQFWLLPKHMRQMEVFIIVLSSGSFFYSLPLLYPLKVISHVTKADRSAEIPTVEVGVNWHQARTGKS